MRKPRTPEHSRVERRDGLGIERETATTLPPEIDQNGTIFAYGFLLDHDNIQRLLDASRPGEEVEIIEAALIEDATKQRRLSPQAVIILRNVELGGVRVNVMTENQLHRAFEKKSGKPIEDYASTMGQETGHDFIAEARENEYLMVRVANDGEVPKTVNGGLVLFSKEDLPVIDADEYAVGDEGIYARKPVPELNIAGTTYTPAHIEFYSGNVGGNFHTFMNPENPDVSRKETARALWHSGDRVRGQLPDAAKWPHSKGHNVRGKQRKGGESE